MAFTNITEFRRADQPDRAAGRADRPAPAGAQRDSGGPRRRPTGRIRPRSLAGGFLTCACRLTAAPSSGGQPHRPELAQPGSSGLPGYWCGVASALPGRARRRRTRSRWSPGRRRVVDNGLRGETVYYYALFPFIGSPPRFDVDERNRVGGTGHGAVRPRRPDVPAAARGLPALRHPASGPQRVARRTAAACCGAHLDLPAPARPGLSLLDAARRARPGTRRRCCRCWPTPSAGGST